MAYIDENGNLQAPTNGMLGSSNTTNNTTPTPYTPANYTPTPFEKVSYLGDVSSPGTYNPGDINQYVPPEALVSNQLNSLLSGNSDYIKVNRNQAAEAANRGGLLGSTMAAGAGQKAAIQSALPIAQGNATTFGNSALENQKSFLTNEQNKLTANLNSGLQGEKANYDYQTNQANNAASIYTNNVNADTTLRTNMGNDLVNALNNYNNSFVSLMTNPNISANQKVQIADSIKRNYVTGTDNLAISLGFANTGVSFNQTASPNPINIAPRVNTTVMVDGTKIKMKKHGNQFWGSDGSVWGVAGKNYTGKTVTIGNIKYKRISEGSQNPTTPTTPETPILPFNYFGQTA